MGFSKEKAPGWGWFKSWNYLSSDRQVAPLVGKRIKRRRRWMGTESLNCPNCGATLQAGLKENTVRCLYCHSVIRITTTGAGKSILMAESADGVSLSSVATEQIQQLLRERRRIEAIKVYRDETNQPLKASKEAVESMAERMGIDGGGAARGSCLGGVIGFLLWMAVLVLTPAGVERAVALVFEDALSGDAVETLQGVGTLFLVLGPVAGMPVWANVGREGKQRRTENERAD
jgi:hypothetical protein